MTRYSICLLPESQRHGSQVVVLEDELNITNKTSSDESTMLFDENRSCQDNKQLKTNRKGDVLNELKTVTTLAVPITGTFILEMLPGIVSIMLVGHLGKGFQRQLYIDAASMATVFINLTGMSTGIGMASAMDTLCSQAFGAGEIVKMGIFLQTGCIVLLFTFISVLCLGYFSEQILLTLGEPEEISHMAGSYVLFVVLGLPFAYLYELLRKTQQAQNITMPMLYVAVISNFINTILGYCFVFHTSWGYLGAAIARTIANVVSPLLLLWMMQRDGTIFSIWTGLKLRQAIQGIPEFLWLGIAGMLQLSLEWWAFEIIYIFCGWLPDATIAIGANAIITNVSSTTFMLYLGLSVSVNVRLGNALGANNQHNAKLSTRVGLGVALVVAFITASFLVILRHIIPLIFTPDPDIDALSKSLIFIASVFQLPDALNAVVQGTFRGSARQHVGAILNFAAYYMLGIPFGMVLAFPLHQGVKGFWIGITCALFFVSGLGIVILERSDWNKLAQEAQDRIKVRDEELEKRRRKSCAATNT